MATEILSANYKTTNFAHSSATSSKNFYVENGRIYMAIDDESSGVENAFVYSAMIRVPKATGAAWLVGDKCYWDNTAGKFTKTSTGNTLCGNVLEAAASGDTEGIVEFDSFA